MPSHTPLPCLVSIIGLLIGSLHVLADEHTKADSRFATKVLPILKLRCGQCHGDENQEGQIRFDQLSTDLLGDRAAAQTWRETLNVLNKDEMPPEGEPDLSNDERNTLTDWISAKIRHAIAKQASTGGRVVLRRLNRDEYQNTMFDLLGLEMDYARDLPPDGFSADGFRNDGRSLRLSAIQLEYYLQTARRALSRIIVTGPPPKVFRHQFEKSNVGGWRGPTEKSNRLERAQKFLVKIVDNYPETGEFRIRVKTRARLRANKGFPLLEVAVGYRPDTEVHFGVAAVKEVTSENLQQFEFGGRMENFPLPVRGQGKYPGLVIRLQNKYDDGTPIPRKLKEVTRDGKKTKVFRQEPDLPQLLIESMEFEGPYYSTWPPKTHRDILFESELRNAHELEYVKSVLQRFMRRAYRRPATRLEVEEMLSFFTSLRRDYLWLEDAVRETLAMILIQPDFLYLMEPAGDTKRPIGDWELASRLSYFLWSSMPDERLFELAARGVLHEPAILQSETERMLRDDRAKQLPIHFAHQWLGLESVDYVSVDKDRYPRFREDLKVDMKNETIEFLAELIRTGESALQLIESDFTMLNEPLARHYGIDSVFGRGFRRVALANESPRGGLLGHAGILLANSTGRDSHPIRRAVWIRDKLLNDPPAPPPPDVPDLDEGKPDFASLSIREQLEIHRDKESCASCHRNIDPWGITLENFDAIGLWRDTFRASRGKNDSNENEKQIDAEDKLPNGTIISGVSGLQAHLVSQRRHDIAESIVRRLLTYALGRSLELTDEAAIAVLVKKFEADEFNLRALIQDIVASRAFQTK